ncbi:RNA polymerase sigma factor [Sinomicrobium soli]|uniref:RNA polymerase sigma factor n=1 Tax=Sinomicrobium sp. N-1-3-6 TaxID=2219864 RepID=UPI0013752018|nr:RNA polymerase sigma factor [Sinomicrobium sp. N-1-3-6]
MEENFILTEIRKRNQIVFKKLFSDHYRELVVYAETIISNFPESEDIVQNVFITIWNDAEKINIKSSMRAYLYAMVRYRCLDYWRKQKKTNMASWTEFYGIYHVHEDTGADVSLQKEQYKLYLHIMEIIKDFPPQMQMVFQLKFIQNYGYQQIADELGISLNTVKGYLKRGKEKIIRSTPPNNFRNN